MTVTFTYKNGRERRMTRQEAEVMRRLGYGQYSTKEERAAPAVQATPASAAALAHEHSMAKESLAPASEAIQTRRGRQSKSESESKQ